MSSLSGCFCWEPVRPLGVGWGGGEGHRAGVQEAEEAWGLGRSGRVPTCGDSWGPEELTDQRKPAPPSTADRPGQPKACGDTHVEGMAQGCHTGCVTAERLSPRC